MNTFTGIGNGLAVVGQSYASIQFVSLVSFILLVCIIGGILASNNHSSSTNATVLANSTCSKSESDPKSSICSTEISYIVGNKTYTSNLSDNTVHNNGQTINSIYYDPSNPNDITSFNLKTIGFIMIFLVAPLILLLGYLSYYLTMNNTTYAAIQGASDISRIF